LDVKEIVRKEYGEIAAGRGQGCCGGVGVEEAACQIGYSDRELAALPEGANLGLGCGNPTAIASLRAGETVVDLGSGAGIDCFLAARQVGPTGRVIGVDMTDEMLERARENARRGGYANVEFRKGDIEALPIDDASVDVVISNCVLNLVPDKRKAFAEVARVLKPGGRMAVSDIVLERPLPAELQGDAATYVGCVSGAILRDEYLRLLGEAGLTEVRVTKEADAAGMLTEAPGPVSETLRSCCGPGALSGFISSFHVEARRPGGATE
jgi:SAM-dependent methyltransferase